MKARVTDRSKGGSDDEDAGLTLKRIKRKEQEA